MPDKNSTPVLLLSGPIGVGKTTVAIEVSNLLLADNVPHTLVDLDGLAATYPRPSHDRFHTQLALRNLSALWHNAQAAGSRNLIIAERVRRREMGAGLDWHLTRSLELARQLQSAPAHFRVTTDQRSVLDVAMTVLAAWAWRRG